MNQPLVSVITPTLNRAEMLAQAIDSVLAQNYENFKHIIIDGVSTDGTLEMLAKYPHLHVISGKDRGMYDAINHGLEIASGEIICFLNSDDLLPPTVLPIVVSALETQPHVDAVVGKAEVFSDAPEQPNAVLSLDFQNELLPQVTRGTGPVFNAWFFRRSVFEKIGNFNIHYRIAADREFMLRFALSGLKFTMVNKLVYQYRRHADSLTFDITDQKLERIVDEHIFMTSAYLEQRSLPIEARNLIRKMRTHDTVAMAVRSLKKMNFHKFAYYSQQGIKYDSLWFLKFTRRVIH